LLVSVPVSSLLTSTLSLYYQGGNYTIKGTLGKKKMLIDNLMVLSTILNTVFSSNDPATIYFISDIFCNKIDVICLGTT